MARQHATPILISESMTNTLPLTPLGYQAGNDAMSEANIQSLIHRHPELLPIIEIDPTFRHPVAVCRELNTPAGPIDNLLITPSGLPIIVECKLWRNPEGRREVVGQILDYAKELSRWSSADLQREVAKHHKGVPNPLLACVRQAGHDVDEIEFNDAVTLNLRRGRFLLLIVGDGIREGVEAIAEYLQAHAGLHFSLGLVELPVYVLPNGDRIVCPRVLTRTEVITRHVIALPDGAALTVATSDEQEHDTDTAVLADEQLRFWAEFLSGLRLDDPEQPFPKSSRQGYISLMLPAPEGSCWITIYRVARLGAVGLTLSFARGYVGETAVATLIEDWNDVAHELGGDAAVVKIRERDRINEQRVFGNLTDPEVRGRAFEWLRERANVFVNVLRPRIRSIVADQQGSDHKL